MKVMSELWYLVKNVVKVCSSKEVAQPAAALAFFLTLSLFPFLICLSAMLGLLDIQVGEIVAGGDGLIPSETLDIIMGYLWYVGRNESNVMLIAGLAVLLTTASAAFRTIMGVLADVHGRGRFEGTSNVILSVVLSLLFLIVIFFSCFIIVSGKWLLHLIDASIVSIHFWQHWSWIRFVILFVILYLIIYAIYTLATPKTGVHVKKGTGALLSAVSLVIISVVFSIMVSLSSRYRLIYGSLASSIILMMWLYSCGMAVIGGSVVNNVLHSMENPDTET